MKQTRRAAPSALIVGLTAFMAGDARAADGNRIVYGAGLITCAEWQQYRSTDNKPATFQVQAWIDGFLSGYNFAGVETDILAPKAQQVGHYAWIDNYCRQNPLDMVGTATVALKNELTARAHR
jgi:hypothetical protein